MDADVRPATQMRRVNSQDTVTTTGYGTEPDRLDTTEPAPKPKVLNLWVHDEAFSKEEVIINPAIYRYLPSAGQVFEVAALKATSDVRDFEKARGLNEQDGNVGKQHLHNSSDPIPNDEFPHVETDPIDTLPMPTSNRDA